MNEESLENDRQPRSKARFIFAITLWLVIVLLVIGIFTPARNAVVNHFLTGVPSPTATLVSGDNLFYIQATPRGTITLDGRTLTYVPDPNAGQRPLQLARGKHIIVWQAHPFMPISCVVFIPSSMTNTCNNESHTQSPAGSNIRLITFNASLDILPVDQQTAVRHTLQETLNTLQSTSIVQPGEHYLTASPSGLVVTRTATQPLKAILSFTLDTNPNSGKVCVSTAEDLCANNGQNCLQLCTVQVQLYPHLSPDIQVLTQGWTIIAVFYPSWTYITTGGHLIAQQQPDSASNAIGTDHSAEFHLTWDSKGWHASLLSTGAGAIVPGLPVIADPICTPLNDLVNNSLTYGDPSVTPAVTVQWGVFAGSNHADGCLGVASSAYYYNFDVIPPHAAYFLYRCGVLLAANPLAHRYFPDLPVADAYEQGLAQRIAARYPQ